MKADDGALRSWFCREVLPLEGALTRYIRRAWPAGDDVAELRQEIYARVLAGAQDGLPSHGRGYVFTVARNHLMNMVVRSKIVSFDLVADLEEHHPIDLSSTERHLDARDQLRRAQAGLDGLPPRCREVVRLRKIEGYNTKEAAVSLGVTTDTVERQLALGMRALVDFMLDDDADTKRPRIVRWRRSDRHG